jgi:hypothetical protein
MSVLSYKEFMEESRQRLSKLSAEELRMLILNWASEEHPSKRADFLNEIIPLKKKKAAAINVKTLMDKVNAFSKKVDEGAYCDGWGWDDAINEERDWGDESWVQEMDAFFLQARSLLLQGEYETAEKVYRKLFETLEMGREPGHLPGDPDFCSMLRVDLEEQVALFLRAIYLNTASDKRPAVLYEAINECQDCYGKVKFRNVINALDGVLPDLDVFLSDWIGYLINDNRRYAGELLREAVVLKSGVAGISEFARQYAVKYPRAYLDWISELEKGSDENSVLMAAREGLSKIPLNYTVRAEIAETISKIGEKRSDNKLKLEGYRECFYSGPSIKYLLDLYMTAIECSCFEEIREMAEHRIMELQSRGRSPTTDYYDSERKASVLPESVLINALILGGRYEKVFEMCKGKGPVGWSSGDNPKPVFTALMIVALSKEGMYSKILYKQWEDAIGYAEYGMRDDYIEKYRKVIAYMIKQYMKLDAEQEEFYVEWCKDEIGRRVDAIVSNQYRGSYHKAAGLLAAMAELLANREEKQEGMDFIERYRNKYPKHSAFKSEINQALQASGLYGGRMPEETKTSVHKNERK